MYSDSVIPFYSYDIYTKKYKSVGSATLVSHRSHLLFITAAHVIESLDPEQTFIYVEQTFYKIRGLPTFVSNCSLFGSRDDDPLDLAAIILPKEVAHKFNQDNFITLDQCAAGDGFASSIFQAIGYPHAKNTKAINKTVRIPKEFRSEGLRYTVEDISYEVFPYKNFCSEYHIATCLTKAGFVQGSRAYMNIPDLHGISGGLLQKVGLYNQVTDGFDIAYPAGIILEKKRGNSAFMSLRLSVVFEWLDLQWEHLIIPSEAC